MYTQDNSSGIPFTVFADLTLLVNYIGMAHHFAECVENKQMQEFCKNVLKQTMTIAKEIENTIVNKKAFSTERILQIHWFGENVVTELCSNVIKLYPTAGIEASRTTSLINQIFRDFFTATQHANFRKK